ncbi:unnamed protein product [Thelazia callipaeda]|uniref:Nucleotid_trans domain-containing protein n=1 Tax=Thelazia callipaeda TaxID=103827 RepID=A0A0N5CQJ2_THECL|nr:unnamed protein product [Thelazia callipaeda]
MAKWAQRGALVVAGYFLARLVVTIVDYRQIIDEQRPVSEANLDGPLLVKEAVDRINDNIVYAFTLAYYLDDFVNKINFKREARIIHSKSDDFLLFTLINGAYLNLTLNWLCNVASFRTSFHRKTLIVSLDAKVCKIIKMKWKEVTCMFMQVSNDYNSPLDWGRQKYINLLTLRSQFLFDFFDFLPTNTFLYFFKFQLELPFILFETDAVWLRDPMKFFLNQTLLDDADIVVPVKGNPDHGLIYSFDPMIVYPTNASVMLMRELNKKLLNNPEIYDQDILDQLCRKQFFGLVCRQFSWNEVADGKWFHLSEAERINLRPYIVNNNYYVGVDNKISRQALNKLWFLSLKNSCNLSKVRGLLRKYEG